MLGYQRWIQTITRGRSTDIPPSSVPHRRVAKLVERMVNLTKVAHVDQVLEALVSDDRAFAEHVQALADVLRVETSSEWALPEKAAGLLAELPRLALAVDRATGTAEDSEMMGTASPFQSTLRMRATATYDQEGPPPEVMDLIAAYQKVPLALLLVYLENHHPEAPKALLVELARIVQQGHLARLAHLAALGYEVPEELIPSAGRLDMDALYMKREPHPQQGGLFATSLEEPDFEVLEHATRAALQQQGQDADDVLRRAAENVRRAGESRELPTDEVLRRATDWVLGQA